jgi:hypothetical protein
MLNFLDFNKKKEKKDYEIVTSRSGLPMFVIEPPDSLNNFTSDDDEDREVTVLTDLEIEIDIDEPVKRERSIPQQVSDYITRHF